MRRSQNWDEVASKKQKRTWGRDPAFGHIIDTGFSSFDANVHLAVGFLYHVSQTQERFLLLQLKATYANSVHRGK